MSRFLLTMLCIPLLLTVAYEVGIQSTRQLLTWKQNEIKGNDLKTEMEKLQKDTKPSDHFNDTIKQSIYSASAVAPPINNLPVKPKNTMIENDLPEVLDHRTRSVQLSMWAIVNHDKSVQELKLAFHDDKFREKQPLVKWWNDKAKRTADLDWENLGIRFMHTPQDLGQFIREKLQDDLAQTLDSDLAKLEKNVRKLEELYEKSIKGEQFQALNEHREELLSEKQKYEKLRELLKISREEKYSAFEKRMVTLLDFRTQQEQFVKSNHNSQKTRQLVTYVQPYLLEIAKGFALKHLTEITIQEKDFETLRILIKDQLKKKEYYVERPIGHILINGKPLSVSEYKNLQKIKFSGTITLKQPDRDNLSVYYKILHVKSFQGEKKKPVLIPTEKTQAFQSFNNALGQLKSIKGYWSYGHVKTFVDQCKDTKHFSHYDDSLQNSINALKTANEPTKSGRNGIFIPILDAIDS